MHTVARNARLGRCRAKASSSFLHGAQRLESSSSRIVALAEDYIRWDPNDTTRRPVEKLLQSSSHDKLSSMFGSRLKFGTAGLRAPFGPGYACMNDLTVIQTAQGLLRYLEERSSGNDDNLKRRGVVLGYDHRSSSQFTPYDLSSEHFARLTASVFNSADVPVYLFENLVATPLVPFSVCEVEAACGVMVTASHNPKEDTGYKVYWRNGAQIVPPHDENISASILKNMEPWHSYQPGESTRPTQHLSELYFSKLKQSCCNHWEENSCDYPGAPPSLTYTAMHGVGHDFVRRAFEVFNLQKFVSVDEQQEPDPTFSTVEFPNPEEGEGALKLAMETADANGSNIIIANDPDADRLAVAERRENVGDGEGGGWRIFTGNEIGSVLGHWMWRKAVERGEGEKVAVLASTVSSKFLRSVAEKEGFLFEETLTGFKWMGNRSEELRRSGYNVVFAYEEAIGYCCGNVVKDKDGVAAAAILAELSVQLAGEKKSIADHLLELKEKYGFYVAKNSYVKFYDEGVLDDIFRGMRGEGGEGGYIDKIGGVKVTGVRDLTLGYDSSAPDGRAALPSDPSSQFVTFTLENGAVVSLRASGTEPKLKYYIEAVGRSEEEGEEVCNALLEGVLGEILRVNELGDKLIIPS